MPKHLKTIITFNDRCSLKQWEFHQQTIYLCEASAKTDKNFKLFWLSNFITHDSRVENW